MMCGGCIPVRVRCARVFECFAVTRLMLEMSGKGRGELAVLRFYLKFFLMMRSFMNRI